MSQDCTLEQKLVLIRRELPGCSAEEAARSLELCQGDVDEALANLSQAQSQTLQCHLNTVVDTDWLKALCH